MFIKIVFSSPYNHESNGAAEVSVREVKNILKKDGRKKLQKGLLGWNTTVKQGLKGTPCDIFIGRPVRGRLPAQKDRRINKQEILEQRCIIQEKIQIKKRRAMKQMLEKGDKVLVQNPLTQKWDKEGVIKEKVIDSDGSVSSFEVECENKLLHRNKRFLQLIPQN